METKEKGRETGKMKRERERERQGKGKRKRNRVKQRENKTDGQRRVIVPKTQPIGSKRGRNTRPYLIDWHVNPNNMHSHHLTLESMFHSDKWKTLMENDHVFRILEIIVKHSGSPAKKGEG